MHSTPKSERPSLSRPERWTILQREDGTFEASHMDSAARFTAIKINTTGSLLVQQAELGFEVLVSWHDQSCECGRAACLHLTIAAAICRFCDARREAREEAERMARLEARFARARAECATAIIMERASRRAVA